MRDYQESVTTGQTDGQIPDKVIPMCCYASFELFKLDMYGPRILHPYQVSSKSVKRSTEEVENVVSYTGETRKEGQ